MNCTLMYRIPTEQNFDNLRNPIIQLVAAMFGDPFPEYVSPALVALVAKHAPAELDLFDNWLRSMNSPVGAKLVVREKSSNNSKRVEKGDVKRVASKNREHQSVSRNVNETSQPRSESSSGLSRYRSTSGSKDNGSPRPRSAPAPKTPTSSLGSARKSSDFLTPVKGDSATTLYKVNERRKGLVNQQSSIGSEVLDSNSSRGSVGSRRAFEKKSGKPPTFEGKEYGKELSLTILQRSGTTDKWEGRSIRDPRVCDSPVGACEKKKPFGPSDEALTSISSRKSHPGGVSWKLELQCRTDKHSPSERKLVSPKTDQAPTSTKAKKSAQKQKTSNKYEKRQTNSYKDRVKQFDKKRRAKMKSANPKMKEHQPPWDFDVAVHSFDGVGPWFGSPTAKQQEMDIPLPVPTFDKFMGVGWESSMKSGDYGPSLRCFQTSIVELCPTITVKQFTQNDVREKRRSGVKHLHGTIKPKSRDPVIKRASWKRGVLIARKPHKSLAALGIVPPSRQQKAADRRMKNSSMFKMGNNRTQRDFTSRRSGAPLKKVGDQIKKPCEVGTKMSTAVRCSGVASMQGMNAVSLNNQATKSTSSRIKQNYVSQNISNATVRRKGVLITGMKLPETPKLPTGKGGQKRKQKEDVAVKKNTPRFSSCRESSNLQENKKLRQSIRENSEDSEKSCLPLIRNLAQQLINRVDAACTYNLFNEAEELHCPGTLSVSEIPDCTVILPDSPLSTSESLILKQPGHIANDSVSDEILYAAALHPSKEKLDLSELEQAGGTPSLEHTSVGKDAITFLDSRSRAGDKEELENSIMLLPEPDVKEDNNEMCLPRIDDNSETKSSRLIQATSDIFQIKLPNVERLKRDKKDDMHGRPSKLRKEEWSLPVKGDPLSVINIYTKHKFCKEKEQSIFYRRECEGGVEIFEIGGDLTPKKGQGCCIEEITSPSGQEAVAVSSTILAGTELVQTGRPDKPPHVEDANQKSSSLIDDKQPSQESIRESTDTTMTSSSSHVVHWNKNLHRKDAVSLWRRLSVEMKKLKRIRRAWRHAYPPAEFKIDGWEAALCGTNNAPVNEFSNHIPQNRRWHRSIEAEHKKSYTRETPLASIEARNLVNAGECAAKPTSARNCEIPTRKQDVVKDTDGLIFPEMDTRDNVLDYPHTRIRKRRKCRILPSLSQEAQKIDWLAKKVLKMRREAQQWRLKWKRHLLETELKRLDAEINETRTRIEKNLYVSQTQQLQVQTCQISQDLPSQSGSGKVREPMEPTVKFKEAPYVQIANTNRRETINQLAKEESESAVDTSNYSDSFISEQENEEKMGHHVVVNKAELHGNLLPVRGNLNNSLRDSEAGLRQSHEIDSSRMEAARDEQHMRGDLRNLWERIKDQKKLRPCSSSIKDLILPENLDCSAGEHDTAHTVSEEEFLTEIQAGIGEGESFAEPVEVLSDHVEAIDKVHHSEHGLLAVVTDNEALVENQDSGVSVSEEFTERAEAQVKHGNAGVNNGSTFQIEVKSEVRFSFNESDTSGINTEGASATKGFTVFPLQRPSPPFQSQDLCLHKGTTDEAQPIDEEGSSESADDADEVQRGSQSEVNIAAEVGVSNRMNTSDLLQRAKMLQNPIFTEVASTSVQSSTSHVLAVTNIKESSGFPEEASVTDEKKNVDERTESHLPPHKSSQLDSTSSYSVKDISWGPQSVAVLQDSSKEVLEEKTTSPTWSYSSEMSNFSDIDQSEEDKGDDRSAGLSHTVANGEGNEDESLQTQEDHFEIQMEKEEGTAHCESRYAGFLSPTMDNTAKKEFDCPSPSTDDSSDGESENLQMEGRADEVQQTEQRVLDSGTQQMEQRTPEIEIQQIEPEQDNETQQNEPRPDYDKTCEKQFLPESHANEKGGAPTSNSIPRNVDNSNPTVQMPLDLDEDEIPEEIVIDELGSTCTEDDADLTSEGYEQDLSRIRAAFDSSTVLEKNDEPGNCDDSGEDSASSKETFLSLSRAYYGSTDPPEQPHTEHGQSLDVQKAVLAEARLEHEIEKIEKHQIFSDRMLFTSILQNEVPAMNPAHAPTTLPSLKTKAGLFPLTKLSAPKLSSKQHEDPNRQLLKRAASLELKGLQNIVASRSLSPVSSRVLLRDDYSTINQQYVQEYVVKFLEFSACPDTSSICSMLENSMQHHGSYQHHTRFNKILYDCVSECMVKGDTMNSEVAPALADKIVSYLKLSRIPACKLVIRLVEEAWQDCDMNVVTAELCEAVLRDLIEELIYEGY